MKSELLSRFDIVQQRITHALQTSGRQEDSIQLVAVSKRHPASAIAELTPYWASQNATPCFGENYVQEAEQKILETTAILEEELIPEWHFIGHLQSRKAKEVIGKYTLIHSVDSEKLALALQKAWESYNSSQTEEKKLLPQNILLQINIGREPQKSGILPEKALDLVAQIATMNGLSLQGLMCLPPNDENPEASRPFFQELVSLRNTIIHEKGIQLKHLSMGMSHDMEIAIAEGATLVRVGTDIFGVRAY